MKFFGFTDKPGPRFYMEYLPLGNLAHVNDEKPLTETETHQLLYQASKALKYLHTLPNPIAHRDIKPGNILVYSRQESFHIKLGDFGFSKDTPDLETDSGTEFYNAPEILIVNKRLNPIPGCEQGPNYDVKVDIWSLGIVLLQYTSCFPGFIYDHRRFIQSERAARKLLNEHSGDVFYTILNGMLQQNPKKRVSAGYCATKAAALPSNRPATPEPSDQASPGKGPVHTPKRPHSKSLERSRPKVRKALESKDS